jgi:hypothetical protein
MKGPPFAVPAEVALMLTVSGQASGKELVSHPGLLGGFSVVGKLGN